MILSSICHVNVDHCQQRCHLQFTMVCADTEIGLGLNSENNNIRICITFGSSGNKKIAKKDFYSFSNLPKSRVGRFEKLFIKKLWPNDNTKLSYRTKTVQTSVLKLNVFKH